ncbi:MAG TPA: HEAT repeat domain-containing protein [Pirellulales bacterium]|jgi:hypothetical protein
MPINQPPDESDLRLDRLLDQARWPEPSEEQLARLKNQWQALSSRRRRRSFVLRAAALAVASSLCVATGWLAWLGAPSADNRTEVRPAEVPQVAIQQHGEAPKLAAEGPAAQEDIARELPQRAIGRLASHDPTPYEQVLLAGSFPARAAEKRVKESRRPQLAHRSPRRPTPKDLAARVARSKQNGDHFAATGGRWGKRSVRKFAALSSVVGEIAEKLRDSDRCEPLLWEAVHQQNGLARLGAAELLAVVATERSLPVLTELASSPDTHAVAIAALARLAPTAEIAQLAVRERNPDLRRVLCAALAARGTEQSVGLYLNLVARPELRRDALDALADVQPQPAELLMAFLRSSDVRARLAAAQALGRVDDPAIVEALAQSLSENRHRQETLVALLLNRSPRAAAIVSAARSDLYLAANVRSAEIELQFHHLTDFSKR